MLGTFQKDFSQVATSHGYYPTKKLPNCAFSSRQNVKNCVKRILVTCPSSDSERDSKTGSLNVTVFFFRFRDFACCVKNEDEELLPSEEN